MPIDKKSQGKLNREAGARFERKVRKDLESKGWIVDRWTNNVKFPKDDLKNPKVMYIGDNTWHNSYGKLIPAKSFMGRSRTNGFPDFIVFRNINLIDISFKELPISEIVSEPIKGIRVSKKVLKPKKVGVLQQVIGVEVKSNGYLSKEEKEKCKWLLENNIFSKILVASKSKKRGKIKYKGFK